jgi:hypothetical protein
MKCPSCGNEQADGWLSCQKCHIIFSRWQSGPGQPAAGKSLPQFQRPAEPSAPPRPRMFGDPPPSPPPSAATRPAPHTASPTAWPVYLALLLPFVAGLWWLLFPRGKAVEPGSYRDERNHFAVHAPAEWVALTRENFEAIMRQYGEQLPGNLSRALSGPGMAVSFVRLGQPGEFSPSLNVVVVQSAPPPINEKSKQEAARMFAQGYAAMFPDYRQESAEIIKVDGLRSLEIVSTASFPFRFPNEAEATALALRSRQVVVPGKKRAYILTFTDTEDAGDDSEEAYQDMRESFRVLKRPPRFGPVVNGGLIGGLLGGLLYLLGSLMRASGNRRD